jgi:hypothetical protein
MNKITPGNRLVFTVHVTCYQVQSDGIVIAEFKNEADANLDAAAPKLLEACKALPLDCEFKDAADFKDNARAFLNAMRLAREAIAIAKPNRG